MNGECVVKRGHSLNVKTPANRQGQEADGVGVYFFVNSFQTELVGLNQIAEVFNPNKNVINIYDYNRIQRYYLQPGDYETDNEPS